MPYTFFAPDSRAIGTGSPALDINNAEDILTGMGAGDNVLNTAFAGGADLTGALDSAPAFNAAIAGMPAGGAAGYIRVRAGTYKIGSTVGPLTTNQWILCDPGVRFNFTGTGDCFRFVDTSTYSARTTQSGGILGFPVIDGTNDGAGSSGLHVGDILAFRLDVAVQNFSKAGDAGVRFDNQNYWTEEMRGYVWATNCTQHVVFDVSGATSSANSFDYADLDTEILAVGNQDGVVFKNGALMVHGRLSVKANFQSSGSAMSNAVLRVTGTVPAGHAQAGQFAAITGSRLDVQAEVPSGAFTPQTIVFGTPGSNSIRSCTGILDFAGGTGTFTPTNWSATANAGGIIYSGIIRGDTGLAGNGAIFALPDIGARGYGLSFLSGTNGNMQGNNGDFFSATLTASITMSLAAGSPLCAMPQRKTIVIKQNSAGGFTVTWPHAGSPTVSAPTVLWAAGAAPVMTATANAVDVYRLDTLDGATWYGTASQNVS